MDTITLFEKLANSVHHTAEINQLIEALPESIKKAFVANDSHQLRKVASNKLDFSDSTLVV